MLTQTPGKHSNNNNSFLINLPKFYTTHRNFDDTKKNIPKRKLQAQPIKSVSHREMTSVAPCALRPLPLSRGAGRREGRRALLSAMSWRAAV